MSPSPSKKHQRTSGRLYAKLFNFLEGKECEAFSAPYDVQLHREDIQEDKVVIPDISVICDKSGIEETTIPFEVVPYPSEFKILDNNKIVRNITYGEI